MEQINDLWLKKIIRTKILSLQIYIALCLMICILLLHIPYIRVHYLIGFPFITLGCLVIVVLFSLYARFSRRFHISVLKKNYYADKENLKQISVEREKITESFQRFVNNMVTKAVEERPTKSEWLKKNEIESMEKVRDDIMKIRKKLQHLLKNEDLNLSTVGIMQDLGTLDALDDENLEHLLESLSLINEEDMTWENGGKESYQKRIHPSFYEFYRPQLKKKTKWLDQLIVSRQERLTEIKEFAKNKGVTLN